MRPTVAIAAAAFAIVGCPAPAPPSLDALPESPPPPPPPDRPAPPAAPEADPIKPASLRPSRPIVDEFRRGLVALRVGDAEPLSAVLAEEMTWSEPLRDPSIRDRAAMVAALQQSAAAPSRLFDLGRTGFVAELTGRTGAATLLLFEVGETAIVGARVYGAPLASDATGTLRVDDPAPATAVVTGRPKLRNVVKTRELYDAASARAWAKIDALVDQGATHTLHADRPSSAAPGLRASLQAVLRDPGASLTIRRHHALSDYVIVEAVLAADGKPTARPVLAFVDVLRLREGKVVASARYANGRPS